MQRSYGSSAQPVVLDRILRAYGIDLGGYLEELALGAKASAPPGRHSTVDLGPEDTSTRGYEHVAPHQPGVAMMTQSRGGSNAKAKRELGWQLVFPSWRRGFVEGLG